jgi:predicted phage-related endonuclease
MIEVKCEQGSPEWIAARIGLPTASNFDMIITPTGKASEQMPKYLAKLAAEYFLDVSLDEAVSQFMERGSEMEAEAVRRYEFDMDVEARKVGLCMTDDGKAGASPDRLVGDDGLLEIKCPSAVVHMEHLLGGVTAEYRVQVQGQLWVTGRKWCDLLFYNPVLPHVRTRFDRDDEFIDVLATRVLAFAERLDAAKARLAPLKAKQNVEEPYRDEDDPFAADPRASDKIPLRGIP